MSEELSEEERGSTGGIAGRGFGGGFIWLVPGVGTGAAGVGAETGVDTEAGVDAGTGVSTATGTGAGVGARLTGTTKSGSRASATLELGTCSDTGARTTGLGAGIGERFRSCTEWRGAISTGREEVGG